MGFESTSLFWKGCFQEAETRDGENRVPEKQGGRAQLHPGSQDDLKRSDLAGACPHSQFPWGRESEGIKAKSRFQIGV